MNGTIKNSVDYGEGELVLVIGYRHDGRDVSLTSATLAAEPLGWSCCPGGDLWRRWDYLPHVEEMAHVYEQCQHAKQEK